MSWFLSDANVLKYAHWGLKYLPYCIRKMCKDDVKQVLDIDREAFPTQWPPPNYVHELQNRLAHYIIVGEDGETTEAPHGETPPRSQRGRLVARLMRLFGRNHTVSNEPSGNSVDHILGFAGFWIMADEAHITSIAVREPLRGKGIGELLLIGVFDLARELEIGFITLEVRVSNIVAQTLYFKYGFNKTGLRRGYYTDNREDAIIMSTENINSPAFKERIQQLREAHAHKWGAALSQPLH